MRVFALFLAIVPFVLFSKSSDSTYVRSFKSEIQSGISAGKSLLLMKYIQPNGTISDGKDIELIIGSDTICYTNEHSVSDTFSLDTGKQLIIVRSKWWGNIARTVNFENQHFVTMEVAFGAIPHEIPNIIYHYDKPVIYLYPEKIQEVNVELDFKGELAFTYPKYNKGWKCTASPNGDLSIYGKRYKYLFWEGQSTVQFSGYKEKRGWIVQSDSLISFFEEKLTKIGLTASEQQDFITYWHPRMKGHQKSFVHFIFSDEYNDIAELNVQPQPDNMIRLFMYWKPLDPNEKVSIQPQVIPHYSRKGFTLVEWGGSELTSNSITKK